MQTEKHLDVVMAWHVSANESGGLLALGEAWLHAGDEPPMHIHAREDETWYVLEGSILFQRGLERVLREPGESLFLPRGVPHGFALQSPKARILHFYTPAGIERAFRRTSSPAGNATESPSLEAIAKAFEQEGVTFVGPPLPHVLRTERDGQ